MTSASMIEVLKAHLRKEGLVLCRYTDTQFPLDGITEIEALSEIAELIEDTQMVDEWFDQNDTKPIPATTLAILRATS